MWYKKFYKSIYTIHYVLLYTRILRVLENIRYAIWIFVYLIWIYLIIDGKIMCLG